MATTCTQPYLQDIPGCSATITFDLDTHASTAYKLLIKYANGAQRLIDVESDADNLIVLTNDNYWHNATDAVTMQLFQVAGCNPETFVNCGTTYDTMILTFKNIITDATNANVPCPCVE